MDELGYYESNGMLSLDLSKVNKELGLEGT